MDKLSVPFTLTVTLTVFLPLKNFTAFNFHQIFWGGISGVLLIVEMKHFQWLTQCRNIETFVGED